jgi:hypothetical protein
MVNNALELKGLALLAAFIACAPDRFATVYSARQRRGGTPSLNGARMRNAGAMQKRNLTNWTFG